MQIESAQERSQRAQKPDRPPEEVAFERQQESIELSRRRVLDDMASALNPRYLEMLQRSLDFLDSKLAALRAEGEARVKAGGA